MLSSLFGGWPQYQPRCLRENIRKRGCASESWSRFCSAVCRNLVRIFLLLSVWGAMVCWAMKSRRPYSSLYYPIFQYNFTIGNSLNDINNRYTFRYTFCEPLTISDPKYNLRGKVALFSTHCCTPHIC